MTKETYLSFLLWLLSLLYIIYSAVGVAEPAVGLPDPAVGLPGGGVLTTFLTLQKFMSGSCCANFGGLFLSLAPAPLPFRGDEVRLPRASPAPASLSGLEALARSVRASTS